MQFLVKGSLSWLAICCFLSRSLFLLSMLIWTAERNVFYCISGLTFWNRDVKVAWIKDTSGMLIRSRNRLRASVALLKKKVRKSCETKKQKQYLIPAHGVYWSGFDVVVTAAPESSNSNSNCDQRRILMSKVESIALMQSQLLKRFPSSFDKSVEIRKKYFLNSLRLKNNPVV